MGIKLLFHLGVNDFIIGIKQGNVDVILTSRHHLKFKEKLLAKPKINLIVFLSKM